MNNVNFQRSVMGSSTVSKSSVSTTESITEDLEDPSYKRDRLASFTGNKKPFLFTLTILNFLKFTLELETVLRCHVGAGN